MTRGFSMFPRRMLHSTSSRQSAIAHKSKTTGSLHEYPGQPQVALTFGVRLASRSTFSVLRSLWMMPFSCSNTMPCAIPCPMRRLSAGSTSPCPFSLHRANHFRRLPFTIYSITRTRCTCHIGIQYIAQNVREHCRGDR